MNVCVLSKAEKDAGNRCHRRSWSKGKGFQIPLLNVELCTCGTQTDRYRSTYLQDSHYRLTTFLKHLTKNSRNYIFLILQFLRSVLFDDFCSLISSSPSRIFLWSTALGLQVVSQMRTTMAHYVLHPTELVFLRTCDQSYLVVAAPQFHKSSAQKRS